MDRFSFLFIIGHLPLVLVSHESSLLQLLCWRLTHQLRVAPPPTDQQWSDRCYSFSLFSLFFVVRCTRLYFGIKITLKLERFQMEFINESDRVDSQLHTGYSISIGIRVSFLVMLKFPIPCSVHDFFPYNIFFCFLLLGPTFSPFSLSLSKFCEWNVYFLCLFKIGELGKKGSSSAKFNTYLINQTKKKTKLKQNELLTPDNLKWPMKRENKVKVVFSLYECQKAHQTHYNTLINLEMSHFFFNFYFFSENVQRKKRNLEKRPIVFSPMSGFYMAPGGMPFDKAIGTTDITFFWGLNILFQFSHFLSKCMCVWERVWVFILV